MTTIQKSDSRTDQSDTRRRSRFAQKISSTFHRKHDSTKPSANEALPPITAQTSDTDRSRPEEEQLADVRRRREVSEKSLEGLEKLTSFYPIGSVEQKRIEQSVVLQTAELEKLRREENDLLSAMGSLSFGRGWHDVEKDGSPAPVRPQRPTYSTSSHQPSAADEEDSPEISRGRSATRPLPQLPSQMRKNSMPRMPTRLQRSQQTAEENAIEEEATMGAPMPPSYDQYKAKPASDWIEYFTDQGVPYYYNTITKVTAWTIPDHDNIQPVSSV